MKRDEFLAAVFGLIDEDGSYEVTKQKAGRNGGVIWTLSDPESRHVGDEDDSVCGVLHLTPKPNLLPGLWMVAFDGGSAMLLADSPRGVLCAILGLVSGDA